MRRYAVIFILIVISPMMWGQSAEKLFSNFSKEKEAEVVDIADIKINFDKSQTNEKGSAKIQILKLDECSPSVKKKFSEEVGKLKDKNYEVLIKAKTDEKNIRILTKDLKNGNKEMLIINTGENPSMIKIAGDLSGLNLEKLLGKN